MAASNPPKIYSIWLERFLTKYQNKKTKNKQGKDKKIDQKLKNIK